MKFYTETAGGKVTRGVRVGNFHAWISVDAKNEEEITDEKREEKTN